MTTVSVGLPVYNGENYLEQAIDSILNQSFRDLELIICDNASTDRTEEICRAAAARDTRVRYTRHPVNLGAAPNFNSCLDYATGKYFKWAAHDDICRTDYLEKCIAVLEADQDIAACHSLIQCIDHKGDFVSEYVLEDGEFSSPDPIVRYYNAIRERHHCICVFGVIRRDVLAKTTAIASYVGSDRNLIAQIVLQGPLVQVPEVLFLSREHPERSIRSLTKPEAGAWFDASRPDVGHQYFSHLALRNAEILFRFPLTVRQRARGLVWVVGWISKRAHIIAWEQATRLIRFLSHGRRIQQKG